jgi:hypothetical protein
LRPFALATEEDRRRLRGFTLLPLNVKLRSMKRLDPKSPAAHHLASGRYVIRQTDAAVLAEVHIPWMREAGWNPGLHDSETFICADPQGFLVGELDGRPIACVSGVRYDDSFGFMVKRYRMSEVFATARMFTGPFPQVNLDWVYGVTTFELG